MEGMLIPQAIGADINCGMRLHTLDLDLERFMSQREALIEHLRGDLFLGSRDLPQSAAVQRAQFAEGLPGWIHAQRASTPLGQVRTSNWDQLESELERVHLGGGLRGDPSWAPSDLTPQEGIVRDAGLGTLGGGNHFIEIQRVDAILERGVAWRLGLRKGQLAFMVHSGSRFLGQAIAHHWLERARSLWPKGLPWPSSGLFPIVDPQERRDYLEAEATAVNYGFINRALLAELLRLNLRALFGPSLEAPLIYDLPHNISLPDGEGATISRKGACPAEKAQPVLIPGSMGSPSFLALGLGARPWLCSASHGAGRAQGRFQMQHQAPETLGLEGVYCISPKAERLIEEAPAAYKPIQPIIDAQVAAGIIQPVARMQPLLTFKA